MLASPPPPTSSPRFGGARRLGLAGRAQQGQHLRVHGFIAATDRSGREEVGLAVATRDETAGFAHDQFAGGDVPRMKTALPEGVEAPRRDIGEIERGAAEAPHVDHARHDRRQLGAEQRVLGGLAQMRYAAADQGLRQLAPPGDAQAVGTAESPLPLLRHIVSSVAGL